MNHILETGPEELSRTHDLIEQYKPSGLGERISSFFWKSFKKTFYEYAQKKEDILIEYTNLHSDIQKDIQKSQALPTDIKHISETILHITENIELCATLLEKMIEHTHGKQDIIHHEKLFFAQLLSSFNADLLTWVGSHEKEVFGVETQQSLGDSKNPFIEGKKTLLMQKKRLETYLKNM